MTAADQAFLYRLADEMSRAPFAPVVEIRGGDKAVAGHGAQSRAVAADRTQAGED